MFEIEKNVPLPKSARNAKYPFAEMEISDTFLAKGAPMRRVSAAASGYASQHPGCKFICRTVDEGVRVWRIE